MSKKIKLLYSRYGFILGLFVAWRILLFVLLFISIRVIPLQKILIGGGLEKYASAPWFWAWSNFDGEHYLSIAQSGYGNGEQAFFPLYPFLIKILGGIFGGSLTNYNWAGLFISNTSFLIALVGLYKLVKLDFPERIARLTLILLLIFPTSFYFGSVYTESLFFAFSIWTVYLARTKKWLRAGVLAAISSAGRFLGILFIPFLLIEFFEKKSLRVSIPKIIALFLVPTGLIIYLFFSQLKFGDPLAFIHYLSWFGEQRSGTVIFLPQVFYRYLFKILPNLNYSYFPVVFSTFLEFLTGLGFLIISVFSFYKLRTSYAVYLTLGYLIPTLSGSFSSLPRYVIVLFPFFIFSSSWLSKRSKTLQMLVLGLSFILLAISTCLFLRGYWVS